MGGLPIWGVLWGPMRGRDVGVALLRQRALVLVVLLVTGGGVALGLSLAPRTYAATATLTVSLPGVDAGQDPGQDPGQDGETVRASVAALARSAIVVETARDEVDTDRSLEQLRRDVEGTWVTGTTLVEVTVRDRDPETAAELATAVAEALAAREGPDVILRDPAAVPDRAVSPDLRAAAALGVLLAVGLAAAGAVARDRRTHTADDAAEVETVAAAPVLGHLTAPTDPTALPALEPASAAAAAFGPPARALERRGPGTTVLTAVGPGDTHVWLAANLAITLAGAGSRVLLVDGRPGEPTGTPGLYDVLRGAALETATGAGPVRGLRVLPPGDPGQEVGLVAERFAAVVAEAEAAYDHVLVVAPPLDESDDARAMSRDAAVVLTLAERAVAASALQAHAERVRAGGADLLGVVLVTPAERPVPA